MIETDEEAAKTTDFYTAQATRLRENVKSDKKADEDDEEAKEALENAFIALQFGTMRKQNIENEKRAAKLL